MAIGCRFFFAMALLALGLVSELHDYFSNDSFLLFLSN
jgi:hypothetical protein